HDRSLQRLKRRSGFPCRGQPFGRRQSEDEPRRDLEAVEDQSRCSIRCACASRSAKASRIAPSASSSHSEALAPLVLSNAGGTDAGGDPTREGSGSAFLAAPASNLGDPPGLMTVRRTSVSLRRR